MFICVAMTVGAMRPDRSPAVQQWLYDVGFRSFSCTMGVFLGHDERRTTEQRN